jgi:hypothetical protein
MTAGDAHTRDDYFRVYWRGSRRVFRAVCAPLRCPAQGDRLRRGFVSGLDRVQEEDVANTRTVLHKILMGGPSQLVHLIDLELFCDLGRVQVSL